MSGVTRRRLLQSSAAGTALIGGCIGDDNNGEPDDDAEGDNGDDGDDSGGGSELEERTMVVGVNGEIQNLDPIDMSLGPEKAWVHLAYNGPLKKEYVEEEDAFDRTTPDLAESSEILTEDGEHIWQITLRDDVYFHNGDKLDAELAKAEAEYWIEREEDSELGYLMGSMDHVTMDNDRTLNIHLEDTRIEMAYGPGEFFLWANPYVREERGREEFSTNPTGGGTGPYEIVEFVEGEKVVLEKFDDYFESGVPDIENLEIRVIPSQSTRNAQMIAGDLHVDPFVSVEAWNTFRDEDEVNAESRSPGYTVPFTGLNHKVEPLGDARVRRALSKAVDREALIEAAYRGRGLVSTLHHQAESWWYEEDLDEQNRHDPEGAQELLEDAGVGDGFSLEMLTSGDEVPQTLAQVVQDFWGRVGVELEITSMDYGAMYGEVLQENYTTHMAQFRTCPLPVCLPETAMDPESAFTTLSNGWENEEFVETFRELQSLIDDRERELELNRKILEITAEEMPTLFWGTVDNFIAYRQEITNVIPHDTSFALREPWRYVEWAD